ncbi:MAG TPA: hypothetical protein VK675_04190 [Candidatus Paceibacterota bacterium]|nr:hypothetical protein [Candidatus Paceibacterota bacterium]
MINPQLLDYIRHQLALGITRENIKKALMSQNWSEQDVNEGFITIEKFTAAPFTPATDSNEQMDIKSSGVKYSIWEKGIRRTNNVFLVIYLILVFGLDLFIIISSPSLAPYWHVMLGVFAVYAVFYLYENFFLRKRFRDTRSNVDSYISFIIVLRNIIVLMNFIPGIQLLGLYLISGFLYIFNLGRVFALGGISIYSLFPLSGPLLIGIYMLLIIVRFNQTKKLGVAGTI